MRCASGDCIAMERLTLFASNADEAADQVAKFESFGHQAVVIDTLEGTHVSRVLGVTVRLASDHEIAETWDETGLHCPYALDLDVIPPTLH
jgi:hypothetical protein